MSVPTQWVDRHVVAQSEEPYMDNWGDAFFQLYVLMTSANYPDVMLVSP